VAGTAIHAVSLGALCNGGALTCHGILLFRRRCRSVMEVGILRCGSKYYKGKQGRTDNR